jgi:hypothetical protein
MSLKDDYWGHTPVFWKKVGDAILALGTAITGATIYENPDWAMASLILTWVGKTITNFASSDKTAP